jgi:hypothetical protein
MTNRFAYALCATLGGLAAGTALAAGDQPVTVTLSPQNASGEKGTVTLTPEGDKTEVVIKLAGAPSEAQPAHIHDGSCAKLDPKPRIPLQNVVGGTSKTTLDMKLSDIIGKGGAINVHKSAADVKTYVACGDLK